MKKMIDVYHLPNITEILNWLRDAKYFSLFDLASGFHQIPIHLMHKKQPFHIIISIECHSIIELPRSKISSGIIRITRKPYARLS